MSDSPQPSQLPATQWTLIARLRQGNSQDSQLALEELMAQYRYPLYCYLRRRGYSHYDADDLLQDFLMKLLRNESFMNADSSKGRLRYMLHVSLDRFVISWERSRHHQKKELSLDAPLPPEDTDSERRYHNEKFQSDETADQIYTRKWTLTLLSTALQKLEARYKAKGKEKLFAVLRPVLMDAGSLRGEDGTRMAEEAGITYGALRTSLMRMLADYQEALYQEILQTVSDPAAAADELAHLKKSVKR